MTSDRIRSLVLCAGAALVALALARHPIAESLVVRGDSVAMRGQSASALAYYRRAIRVDSADGVALDRFAFGTLLHRDEESMRAAIRFCSDFLQRNPHDGTIRFDRALLFRATGNLRRAELDFLIDGRGARNPRAMTFAGFIARSGGRMHEARSYWKAALTYAPDFSLARRALARLGSQ